jgi:AraC-like DNA-binding protein
MASDSPRAAKTENTVTAPYQARFERVLRHIDEHPEENLSVDRLSDMARFSKFHFHRQFAALFGIGVYRYVQLVRLKRASYQLAFRAEPILEIALDAGYEDRRRSAGPSSSASARRRAPSASSRNGPLGTMCICQSARSGGRP